MGPENPFREGDRVVFVGTRRHQHLLKPPYRRVGAPIQGPAHGRVKQVWRKGSRHMVDVDFDQHGYVCCYHDELKFDVLDTLGAM